MSASPLSQPRSTPVTGGQVTDLPDVLARWRRETGHTLSNAAAGLGVATATWGHWERGARFPNGRNLDMLSRMTGLSIRELLCARYDECPFRQRD